MAQKSMRLDLLLTERGLLPSRQAAQAAIMDGGVLVDGNKITKPGTAVRPDAMIELLGDWKGSKYVSRGGLKLERALEEFGIDASGRVCLDVGASTGGFTDCLLQRGASRVYAIDVGYGQLEWKLRQDERVIVKERVNARYLKPDQLYKPGEPRADLAVMDLSFISVLKVLPACIELLAAAADIVALIKPQFEAGKQAVGKGGVVRERSAHETVLKDVVNGAEQMHLQTVALTYSPIKGPAGNIEFLAHFRKTAEPEEMLAVDIANVVLQAHTQLSDK
jgi:23S rRNA (cytidine1920-2'-O)/16S rRNA (cytidine1409-2'-O)-methyltransferase